MDPTRLLQPPSPPLPPPEEHVIKQILHRNRQWVLTSRPKRQRRIPHKVPIDGGRRETIPAPYPWATDQRATVRNLSDLLATGVNKISGQVNCKKCLKKYELEFDLMEKFNEVSNYFAENKESMYGRAPEKWLNPVLPTCRLCEQENSIKPVIPEEMDSINWLFLLLGEMIGLCTLHELRYLCKNTNKHRTAAKDRLLYMAYLTLCHQVDPNGPFNR